MSLSIITSQYKPEYIVLHQIHSDVDESALSKKIAIRL